MEVELHSALKRQATMYTSLDSLVLQQLAQAAQQHGLDPKQAAKAFDKYMTVKHSDKKSVGESEVRAWSAAHRSSKRPGNLFDRMSLEDMIVCDTAGGENGGGIAPSAPSQRITPHLVKVAALRPTSAAKAHTPQSSGKFAERQNAGSVVACLNSHLEVPADEAEAMDVDGDVSAASSSSVSGRVEVEVLGQPLRPGAKYMVDRLEDKVGYLERRILAAEAAAEAALGHEPHPVGMAVQQESLLVGRICCDAEGGRLNPQSLLLEGSQKTSGGQRVRLDVSKLPAFRLFPGQVVAVRGTNPSGLCVVASQLLPGFASPLPSSNLSDLAAAAGGRRRGVSMVVAAGPFSSSEDLEYAPLGALLDYCAQPAHRPDLLLLLGPFVDVEHPLLQNGLAEESFEELYASRVLGQLRRYTATVGGRTRVLLVPSTRDAHLHPVLPQPPLPPDGSEAAALGGPGTLALANPATLRCSEVVLGCTSADWLMACNREDCSRCPLGQADERLPALAAHLAAQRSYFPMFPPPADVPLDCSRAGAALAMPATPDLLVLPSDLAPFAKVCSVHGLRGSSGAAGSEAAAAPGGSTVCINPGRLTKGASGGTFAHLHILPLKEALDVAAGAPPATNAPVPHRLDQRCRVEIKRI